MTEDDPHAELARLRAENEHLKRQPARGLQLKVSAKGALSVYGLSRFPVTPYKEQWTRLLETDWPDRDTSNPARRGPTPAAVKTEEREFSTKTRCCPSSRASRDPAHIFDRRRAFDDSMGTGEMRS